VPHFVGVFGQLDAFEFAFAPIVEQTKLDLGGMARKQGKIDTKTVPCGTEWERFSLSDVRAPQQRGRLESLSSAEDDFIVSPQKGRTAGKRDGSKSAAGHNERLNERLRRIQNRGATANLVKP